MNAKYLSVVYDLTEFGIQNIKDAILFTDMDDGITIECSFDGGATFYPMVNNEKLQTRNSNGKFQVRIFFGDVSTFNIYTIKTSGSFSNLEVGTTINFTKKSTNEIFTTSIDSNGAYKIYLPRGEYSVWCKDGFTTKVLIDRLDPIIFESNSNNIYGKEAIIEAFVRDVDWVDYSIFDTFLDGEKMLYGDAIITGDGNLSDGKTDRICRYWALGFNV